MCYHYRVFLEPLGPIGNVDRNNPFVGEEPYLFTHSICHVLAYPLQCFFCKWFYASCVECHFR